MGRLFDTSATNTTCQILTSLVAIAAIAIGSPQTASADSLLFRSVGNVTAGLFAPTVKLTSVVDVDDSKKESIQSVLESEDGPEPMTTVPEAPQLLSQIASLSQPQPVQTSPQPRIDTSNEVPDLRNRTLRRPPALLPLYVTYGALQLLDAHTTTKALQTGAVEANPVVAPFAGNTGALYATKIAATAATVYVGEKLWRRKRFAAVMTMIAVNSAYAVVVHHNYGIANR